VEVSHLPRTMDAMIRLQNQQEIARVRSETPFTYFLLHNQIEFKGRRDPLTIEDWHRIWGRTHLYLGEQGLSPTEMTVTIVCSQKPVKVLYHSKDHVEFHRISPGYYVSDTKPLVYIIAINELEIIERNYPLLVFASSERKFRQFLKQTFDERNFDYVPYAYAVRPEITKEELAMAGRHQRLSRRELQFIAQDIGAELITFLSPEERLRGLSVTERIQDLNPNELKQLKQLIENLENQTDEPIVDAK
jgi:hypothetical protein